MAVKKVANLIKDYAPRPAVLPVEKAIVALVAIIAILFLLLRFP